MQSSSSIPNWSQLYTNTIVQIFGIMTLDVSAPVNNKVIITYHQSGWQDFKTTADKLDTNIDTNTLPLLTYPIHIACFLPWAINVTVTQCQFALRYHKADVILQYKRHRGELIVVCRIKQYLLSVLHYGELVPPSSPMSVTTSFKLLPFPASRSEELKPSPLQQQLQATAGLDWLVILLFYC